MAKTEWEGGVMDAIISYGLSTGELPHEAPAPVREAWDRLYDQARRDITLIEKWLYNE